MLYCVYRLVLYVLNHCNIPLEFVFKLLPIFSPIVVGCAFHKTSNLFQINEISRLYMIFNQTARILVCCCIMEKKFNKIQQRNTQNSVQLIVGRLSFHSYLLNTRWHTCTFRYLF